MKARLLFRIPAVFLLLAASCGKQGNSGSAAGTASLDALAAERAALEDERMALERQRLDAERAALEEEKAALLAEREKGAAALDATLEERQREIEARESELADRETDLSARESDLSEQEYASAGSEALDGWEPEPLPEAQEPVADYGTFYDDLQPYGSWYETPDYGYVYQPTVVIQDSSWRPYTRGRWACTNLGWNWISDEPFGWACFHYGRWCYLARRGWVWVPGDEWAPSWVCWREGGGYVGWAPLPPETLCYRGHGWGSNVELEFGIRHSIFNFVHSRHMADPLWKHCLPLSQNEGIVAKTGNITNIRYHRNRIVSGGPHWEKLRRVVGKSWPVYQLQIDRLKGVNQRGDRDAVFRGNKLAVFAPNLSTRWNAALKPPRVAAQWDDVKAGNASPGMKPEWRERFLDARRQQKDQAVIWTREHGQTAAPRDQLAVNRRKVEAAQAQLDAKQKAMTEKRRGRIALERAAGRREDPAISAQVAKGRPAAASSRHESAGSMPAVPRTSPSERRRGQRDGAVAPGAAGKPVEVKPSPVAERQERDRRNPADAPVARVSPDRREPAARPQGPPPGAIVPRQPGGSGLAESRRQAAPQARQEQERQIAEGNARRQRMEEARGQAEQARRNQEESRVKQEQARRQGEENSRRQRQDAMERQQQADNARKREEDRSREQQAERARQQQEETRRQAAERGRQQQEERARQQERMRQQQEERARQQQEERARQQQERTRQEQQRTRNQQEEMRRQRGR